MVSSVIVIIIIIMIITIMCLGITTLTLVTVLSSSIPVVKATTTLSPHLTAGT